MDTFTLQAPRPFPRKAITVLLSVLMSAFLFYKIPTAYASWAVSKELEELIDDEKVWDEVKDLKIPEEALRKITMEIGGIKSKTRKPAPCEQYVIRARMDGLYNCYLCPTKTVALKAGEIYRIGKTCFGENGRYPNGLDDKRLQYYREFDGNEINCLIVEKLKLYAYFYSNENQQRQFPLVLPPDNKIYR